MSKMDNLRAMREARYEEAQKRAAGAGTATPSTTRSVRRPVAQSPKAPQESEAPVEADAAVEALCGHRNMGGRTCTREAGHAAKSHRYS
jgi:hypothetical protein